MNRNLPCAFSLVLSFTLVPGPLASQKEIVGLGFEKKRAADVVVTSASVVLGAGAEVDAAAKARNEFRVILRTRVVTDKEGEFTVAIPPEQFQRIPPGGTFDLVVRVSPPQAYAGRYESDSVTVRLEQRAGPAYRLILYFVEPTDRAKTNKGTFAVSSKAQT